MRALAEGGGQLVIGAGSGWRVMRPESVVAVICIRQSRHYDKTTVSPGALAGAAHAASWRDRDVQKLY
jgi:hypothetical protein